MNKKEYADILRFAINMQIGYVEEEMKNSFLIKNSYREGIIRGLQIALEKIDASEFLMEE